MKEFKIRIAAAHEHIDRYGHVNYLELPKLYEFAQDRLLEEHGFSWLVLEEKYGIRSVVRSLGVEYFRQLFEGDEVIVTTSVDFGNTRMVFEQYMEKGEEMSSKMKTVVVAVDSKGNKVPWPEEFKEAFKG